VSTWDHVLDKLQGGADLMTPGLTIWNSEIKSGNVTAVTLQDGVAIAVGIAAFDIGRLSKAAGEKGKAVYLVHCYKDELWGLGTKTHPRIVSTDTPTQVEEKTQQLSLEDNIEETNTPADLTDNPIPDSISQLEDNKVEPSISGLQSFCRQPNLEIDDAFKMAAIYGLYQVKISDAQNTISLPLPSSTLVSSHLNPYLPEAYAHYNFKKTSWKKAASFLKKYLEKEGVIKTKDRGGETIILSINWNHKFINEFEPYHITNKETDKSGTKNGHPSMTSPQMQVHELFKPSGKALKAILESQSKS
jgi:translation initiation factor 2D